MTPAFLYRGTIDLEDFWDRFDPMMSNPSAVWELKKNIPAGTRKPTNFDWMFGETTIFHVKNRNHPIETSILKWMLQVPGRFSDLVFEKLICASLKSD